MEREMYDTKVYQCSKCMTKNEDVHVPCTLVMGNGDIPDHCVFERGRDVTWE